MKYFIYSKPFENFYKELCLNNKFKKYVDYELVINYILQIYDKYKFKVNYDNEDAEIIQSELLDYIKTNHYKNGFVFFTNKILIKENLKIGDFEITNNKNAFEHFNDIIKK